MNKLKLYLSLIFVFSFIMLQAQKRNPETITGIARGFLGKPYVASVLDNYTGDERLIIDTDSIDCTTFVEYVMAAYLSDGISDQNDSVFIHNVERIRYRSGKMNGYASRLHYFSDWIIDNAKKGILTEITDQFETVPAPGRIDFMSTHPEAYRQLRENPALIDSLKTIEHQLSKIPAVFIPKERLAGQTDQIREGDIIAIVTTVDGLDISHVGFATRREGRVHLLHASLKYKKVVTDPTPLTEYLLSHKSQKGIRILRLN